MEQLNYNLLFRWFVGLDVDDPVWDVTVSTKNRDRLLRGGVSARFLAKLVGLPEVESLLSEEYFSVDDTRISAWASVKSFRSKEAAEESGDADTDGAEGGHNEVRDFRASAGRTLEARLSYLDHALIENRNGLVEEVFGWVKMISVMAKTRHRGLKRVGWQFTLAPPS